MKRIICPVDFSEAAGNAVEYAANLARDLRAELFLLYIQQVPLLQDVAPMSGSAFTGINDKAALAREKLKTYALFVQEKFKIRCDYAVKSYVSGIEEALGEEIRQGHFDLVVMGTNGADNLKQFFLGTHSYHAVRKTTCPLLIVPASYAFNGIRRVIYATDYSPEDSRCIPALKAIIAPYQPRLTILHISKKNADTYDKKFQHIVNLLKKDIKDDADIQFKRLLAEDVAGSLSTIMHNSNTDLLVLLAKHYPFLKGIFHQSIIRKLSFIADFPILIFHS